MSVLGTEWLIDYPQSGISRSIGTNADAFFSNSPQVLRIDTIDSTHIRVIWAQPLVNDASLTCLETYVIVPPVGARDLNVYAVVPEGTPNATSCLLTIDEMLQGGAYLLDVLQLRVAV